MKLKHAFSPRPGSLHVFNARRPHQGPRECARRLAKPLHQPTGHGDQYGMGTALARTPSPFSVRGATLKGRTGKRGQDFDIAFRTDAVIQDRVRSFPGFTP